MLNINGTKKDKTAQTKLGRLGSIGVTWGHFILFDFLFNTFWFFQQATFDPLFITTNK